MRARVRVGEFRGLLQQIENLALVQGIAAHDGRPAGERREHPVHQILPFRGTILLEALDEPFEHGDRVARPLGQSLREGDRPPGRSPDFGGSESGSLTTKLRGDEPGHLTLLLATGRERPIPPWGRARPERVTTVFPPCPRGIDVP